MLQSLIKAGPGSVELPRSQAPVIKANDLLYVHFERPILRGRSSILATSD